MTDHNSPDQWEAADIIESLKAGIPLPGNEPVLKGVCSEHHRTDAKINNQSKALIWIVRRMELNGKAKSVRREDGSTNYLELAKGGLRTAGWPAIIIALVVGCLFYMKYLQQDQVQQAADVASQLVIKELKQHKGVTP